VAWQSSGRRIILGISPSALDRQDRARIWFFGLSLRPEGLAIAEKTLNNFVERATRLYEQGPGDPCGSTRFGEYAQWWVIWAGAEINPPVPPPFK
jgi:hypothetical protein